MSSAQQTTDHDTIRKWVEKHGGRPARVADTAPGGSSSRRGSGGILRIDFAAPEEELEEISWDEFFKEFERHKLAFLFQEKGDSRFHKFVSRD